MRDIKPIFYKLMSDAKFRELVFDNFEVTPWLIMNTDLTDVECKEMETMAEEVYHGTIVKEY